jgi:hyperosmotically inducible periplasmic protein
VNSIKNRSLHFVLGAVLLSGLPLLAQPRYGQQDQSTTPAPDNTATNKRDRDSNAKTADQQKMNPSDRETTRSIRKALMADKSLSTYAHNVKIITQDGMVTLKGPVRSDDEKASVEAKAAKVAGGADKVHSEISVAPPKSPK